MVSRGTWRINGDGGCFCRTGSGGPGGVDLGLVVDNLSVRPLGEAAHSPQPDG